MIGKQVAGAMNFLVNVVGLSLQFAWVMRNSMLLSVLMHSSETMCGT